jgi:hypothetical protein
MTTDPDTNQPVDQPTKTRDQELQESMPSQAELDAKIPGHVPSAAERVAEGEASPWLTAAQADPYVPAAATAPAAPGNLFFTYERPDGSTFIAAASSAEQYLSKGFKVTGEQTVADSNELRKLVSPGSVEPAASGVAGLGGSGGTEEGPSNTGQIGSSEQPNPTENPPVG